MKRLLLRLIGKVHLLVFGHPPSDSMKDFLGNFSLLLGSGAVYGAAFLVVNLAAARVLGPPEFGRYQLGLTLANFFLIAMSLGNTVASIKYLNESGLHRNALGTVFIVNVGAALSWMVILGLIASWADLIKVDHVVWLTAVFLALTIALYNLNKAALQSYSYFKYYAAVEILTAMVLLIGFLAIRTSQPSGAALMLILAISYLAGSLFGAGRYLGALRNAQVTGAVLGHFFRYIGPGFVLAIATFTFGSIDRFYLNWLIGDQGVGIASAYLLSGSLIFGPIVQIFTSAFFPSLLKSIRTLPNSLPIIIRKLDRLFVLGLVFLWPLILLASLTVLLIIGREFPIRGTNLVIFSTATFLSLYSSIYQLSLSSVNERQGLKESMKIALVAAMVAVGLGYPLVQSLGVTGSGLTLLLAFLTTLTLSRWRIRQSMFQMSDHQSTKDKSV